MTAIGFDAGSGSLIIVGNGVYQARTLTADMGPEGYIAITSLAKRGEQYVLWSDVTDLEGGGFATPAGVMAYLQGEFAKSIPVGEVFGIATVAGADLVRGVPVAVSRGTGHLVPARADTYALAFVVGLASADTENGFTDQPVHGATTLSDWSVITGAAALSPGVPYFLAASGGLTPSPPTTLGAFVTRVGVAVSPTTLVVAPTDPITL